MDFSEMPDNVFVKILSHVPLEERIRTGDVNECFRRMSQISISQTKELDLSYSKLTPNELSEIFCLCRENLEKMKTSYFDRKVNTVAEFWFPRLQELEIRFDHEHGNDLFDEIMAKNRNIQKLTWVVSSFFKYGDDQTAVEFAPTFVPMDNLTHLDLQLANSSMIRKFIVCHPNLRQFSVKLSDGQGAQDALEEFFEHFSTLEEFEVYRPFSCHGYPEFDFLRSESVWRLKQLKKLKIGSSENLRSRDDEILTKMAASFANLEQFTAFDLVATNRGLGESAKLKKLRDLVVRNFECGWSSNFDQSIVRLAENGVLQRFYLPSSISPSAFVALVSKCTHLRYLGLYGIEGVETPQEAAQVVRSLFPYCNGEKRWLIFYPYPCWEDSKWDQQSKIWFDSDEVSAVLKELRDETKFEVGLFCHCSRGVVEEELNLLSRLLE